MKTSRASLDRQQVLRAALSLIDQSGLAALSMRALGASLGVQAMSLYEHVQDKDAVLDGVVELLVDEIDIPESGDTGWRDFLMAMSRSYRAVALRHPAAFVLMVSRPLATPAALLRFETALDGVRRAGFPPEAAPVVFLTIESFTSGMALNEIAGSTALDLTGLDAADYPNVSALAPLVEQAGPDDMFDACLAAVVDGLGRLRTKPARPRKT